MTESEFQRETQQQSSCQNEMLVQNTRDIMLTRHVYDLTSIPGGGGDAGVVGTPVTRAQDYISTFCKCFVNHWIIKP